MKEVQRWECLVEEVDDEWVYVRAIDVTATNAFAALGMKDQPEDFIDFPLDTFPVFERVKMKPGRIFNWTIYADDPDDAEADNISEFEFSYRRWTQEEIDEAERRGDELWRKLHPE